MKKRYGFIYVDKNNDGSGTLARSPKKSFHGIKTSSRVMLKIYKIHSIDNNPALIVGVVLYSSSRRKRFWLIHIKRMQCCARDEKRYNPAIFLWLPLV